MLTREERMCALKESEMALINILTELGAAVQLSFGSHGRPQRFQAFWPDGAGYDGRHVDYDARAHANVIP